MRYRLTCLTPVLVGDGTRLAPIDYMVWKNHVNVLDQTRIFRLLAKGPRLEGYLKQIQRADKLDFASWGGFAQNFADRRIPFEHPACGAYWEALPSEQLHIPTFIASHAGPYLPGSALKGALRTGYVSARGESAGAEIAARLPKDGALRNPGQILEERAAGGSLLSRLKPIQVSDSAPVGRPAMKVYLLRTATLERKANGQIELRWKQSPRGSVEGHRPETSTPQFAEMASPGTVFEGNWAEKAYYRDPEVLRSLRWKEPVTTAALLRAANDFAARMLEAHRQYAELAGLRPVAANLAALEERLGQLRGRAQACLVALGWGGGFLTKTAGPNPDDESYRQVLREIGPFGRSMRPGLPFPKTRRIVFLENQPATLAGWAQLEIE